MVKRVLLDENIAHKLRFFIPNHEVVTASYAGFAGLKNGALLKAAEDAGFDVLVTSDTTLPYEQNLTGRAIAIVSISAIAWIIIEPNIEQIAAAVDRATPGSFGRVECGKFVRPRRKLKGPEPG